MIASYPVGCPRVGSPPAECRGTPLWPASLLPSPRAAPPGPGFHRARVAGHGSLCHTSHASSATSHLLTEGDEIKELLEDDDCRNQAAGALGALFRASSNRDILRALFEVIKDGFQRSDLRAFAYVAFLDVLGVPRPQQPSPMNLKIGDADVENARKHLMRLGILLTREPGRGA
jgi:hypothetical protein